MCTVAVWWCNGTVYRKESSVCPGSLSLANRTETVLFTCLPYLLVCHMYDTPSDCRCVTWTAVQSNCHFASHQILYLEVWSTSSRDCCSSVTIGHSQFLAIEGSEGRGWGAWGSAKWSEGVATLFCRQKVMQRSSEGRPDMVNGTASVLLVRWLCAAAWDGPLTARCGVRWTADCAAAWDGPEYGERA